MPAVLSQICHLFSVPATNRYTTYFLLAWTVMEVFHLVFLPSDFLLSIYLTFRCKNNLSKTGDTRLCIGVPAGSVAKNPPANAGAAGDVGSIPGLGSSPGGGNGNPLQCSCLGSPMDRGSWRATAHGVRELDPTERLTLCSVLLHSIITSFFSL